MPKPWVKRKACRAKLRYIIEIKDIESLFKDQYLFEKIYPQKP